MVRVGGNWKDITSFIREYEDEEVNKGNSNNNSDFRNESKIGSFNKSLDNMSTVSSSYKNKY